MPLYFRKHPKYRLPATAELPAISSQRAEPVKRMLEIRAGGLPGPSPG